MGMDRSKQLTQQQSLISINEFYGLKQQNQPLYQSKIMSKSRTNNLLKRIIPFTQSCDNVNTFLRRLQKIGQYIECQNLYIPVECQVKEQPHVCSQYRQIELYYEIYNIKIKDQIKARKRYNEGFTEEQLWYILYSVLNACRKFQHFFIKSGDLKTQHLLLNQKGHLKLVNQLTEPENQIKSSIISNYYSPEELLKMGGVKSIRINPNICQTFSIAIIMLELCTFIDGDSFYDLYRLCLKQNLLIKAFQIMGQKYSKLLYNLINIMITDYRDRPLPSQIYFAFKSYENNILALKPFQFDANKFYQSLYQSKADYI